MPPDSDITCGDTIIFTCMHGKSIAGVHVCNWYQFCMRWWYPRVAYITNHCLCVWHVNFPDASLWLLLEIACWIKWTFGPNQHGRSHVLKYARGSIASRGLLLLRLSHGSLIQTQKFNDISKLMKPFYLFVAGFAPSILPSLAFQLS